MEGGVDGILVENYGDRPFFPWNVPPETVAALAVVVAQVVAGARVPVGVNVLRNDAAAALAVAAATGARFIRVNVHMGVMVSDQGLLQGRAYETLRTREALSPSTAILADVLVKHAVPPPGLTLQAAARDTWMRGLADGLVLSGPETGWPVDPHDLHEVRRALPPDAKIWIGSGANRTTARSFLDQADGVIVGSALQRGGIAGSGVELRRVRAFMRALGRG
jgi:membrane complex biogenesis BtpA family protein